MRAGRATVWVVDDSPLDAEHARQALAPAYEVSVFPDGSAVLERLAAGPVPDVIVCDWFMPGITGIDVTKFIRTSKDFPQVSVLLVTARHSVDQIVDGLAAGANDYVSKPYAEPELLARVGALVRAKDLLSRVELAQQEARDLLESSPDPLLGVDAHGVVRFANLAAESTFGGGVRGRALGSMLPGLDLVALGIGATPPDLPVGERTFAPTVRFSGRGTVTVSLRDVTERRRAENKRLDLYAIIAHDMRSPLQSLLMRLELLARGRRGPLPADVIGDLQRIDSGLRSLVVMVNDFLELAKMDGRAMNLRPLDLRDLLRAAFDELRPLADARGLEVSIDGGPAVQVIADSRQLVHVFTNLFGNAIKFTDPGGQIRASVETSGDFVVASIADTGRGISAEALPTIFNRFTRGKGVEAVVGSGLGLMIVREIVEAHGGTVAVRSTVGEGTTFSVKLPRPRGA